MIKKNKLQLILSSIVILLPMIFGFFGDAILPEEIIIHWGIDGTANGWGSHATAFIVLPLILLAVHWLCVILTVVIDKNDNQNKMLMNVMFWVIPIISISVSAMMVTTALGYTSNIFAVMLLLFALLFIFIGNYMPKTVRNRTMGIKIKWTLANDENWNATHRFAGKLYVAIGFICILAMPLPEKILPYVAIALILTVAIIPMVYSYRFYKKQIADGRATKENYEKGYLDVVKYKKLRFIIIGVIAVVLIFVMFWGKIELSANDTGIEVKASFWSDLSLNYEDIDAAEYRENAIDGARVNGFASARLLLGYFKNDEFGNYTRYTYTGDKPCIVLTLGEDTVVIGAGDDETLKAVYDRIIENIS